MAAAPADAAAVSVRFGGRRAVLVAALTVAGSGIVAQRTTLPVGLKAGHHIVRFRSDGRGQYWAPADTGTHPLLVLLGDSATVLDSVLPPYLATHGYAVERTRRVDGDARPAAVVEWRPDTLEILVHGTRVRVSFAMSPPPLRTLCAMTHAILDAELRGLHPTVRTLVARLRDAGAFAEATPER